MKTIIAGLSLILIFSFTNKNTVQGPLADFGTENPTNPDTIKPKSTPFSAEDSLKFYQAVKDEEALINEFCTCATEKGRGHADCSTFIKQKRTPAKIQEKIWNKYLYGEHENRKVASALSKEIERLTEKFNSCGKK